MNSELDFWAGLVIGFVAAVNVGVITLGLCHARNESNRERARKAEALIRERMQASLHVPDKSLSELVAEIHSQQWELSPEARRSNMRVVP